MNDLEKIILQAVQAMGKLNSGQLRRFLFEGDLWAECDLAWPLAQLRQDGLLEQTLGATGIHYGLTDKGTSALEADPLPPEKKTEVLAKAEEYRALFQQEQDYLAEYSEQATGIVPVFLSIRQKEKILFKVSIIVPDVQTAERIKHGWMSNAQTAYEQVWQCIAPGEPIPHFE